MARQKLTVEKVYIVEEVVGYDSSEILAVCATLERAQAVRAPKRWYEYKTNSSGGGETYWLSMSREQRVQAMEWLIITEHEVLV